MRLSNIDSFVDKIEDFPVVHERRRPIESHAIPKIHEFNPSENEKRSRKSSDILLGENPNEILKNSVIKKYCNDIIYKKRIITLKRKRDRNVTINNSISTQDTDNRGNYYSMKTKTGLSRKLHFVQNPAQKTFYEFFDSQIFTEVSLFSKSNHKRDEKHLSDYHIKPSTVCQKNPSSCPRRVKRQFHNSLELPESFLPTMTLTSELSSKSGNSTSVRKSPTHLINRSVNAMISPFKVKIESSNTFEDKELPRGDFVENNYMDELPDTLDELNSPLPFSTSLKRQQSSEIFTRKKQIYDRMSMGHISLGKDRSEPLHRSSFDLDHYNDMGITRVQSVVVKKSRNNFSFNNMTNMKPNSKFEILEQWTKGESRLRLLVIFNETTTLKIKLLKVFVQGGNQDQKEPKPSNSEGKLSGTKSKSVSDEDECENRPHSGKYIIEHMKPLMFAKDPIKNTLFEHTIKFVQENFWYDTLNRFLDLVDLIYSDLVQYYSKALKEFSATQQMSRIEIQEGKECLVIVGNIKSAKLSCSTPIFGKDKFTVTPLAPETYAHMPMAGNKKLPTKGPMSELSSSLADSLTAFRCFMSTFT